MRLRTFQRGQIPGWRGVGAPRDKEVLFVEHGKYTLRLANGSEGTVLMSNLSRTGGIGGRPVTVRLTLDGVGPAPF